jgi:hypothetical protein
MEPNDLPIVCIPLELPDEAAAELLEFLRNLTETLERHYFGQLHRLAQARAMLGEISDTARGIGRPVCRRALRSVPEAASARLRRSNTASPCN